MRSMNAGVTDSGILERAVTMRQFAAALRGELARALGCRRWWWAREVRAGAGTEWRVAAEGTAFRPAADAWETLCGMLRRTRSPRRGPVPGAAFVSDRDLLWLIDGRTGRRGVVVAAAGGRPGPADSAREAALGLEMRAAYARALAVERIERECALYESLMEESAEAVLLLDWDLNLVARSSGAAARSGKRVGEFLPAAVRQRLYLMRATWERALLSWEKPGDETAFLREPDGFGVEIRMLAGREPEAACPRFLLRFRPATGRPDPAAPDWRALAIRHGIEPGMLRQMAGGAATVRMASAAGVSPAAIRARLSRLYRRFGCAGRMALLRRLTEEFAP